MATPPQPPLPPCGPWKSTAEELGIISVSGDTESMADSHDHLRVVQPHYESNMGRLPHDFALRAPCPDDDEQGTTSSIAIITSSQSIMESQIMFNNRTRDSDEAAPTIQRQQQQDVLVDSAAITQDGVRTPAIAATSSLNASNQIRNTDDSNHVAASPPPLRLGRPIPRRPKCSVATMSRKKLCLVVILQNILLLGAIMAVIILAIDRSTSDTTTAKNSDGSSKNTAVSTINTIRERGYLICGVVERPGFSTYNGTTWTGFEVDLCRAIGAAIFGSGDDHNVNFTNLSISDRFIALQAGKVDLLAAGVTYTMERDLYEPTVQAGFAFSTPYLYNGLSLAGQPKYVDCAEQRNTSGNCSGLSICVQDKTTHVDVIRKLFPSSKVIKLVPSVTNIRDSFIGGYCNVLAGERFDLAFSNVNRTGYTGNYSISNNLYSKEPIALVTRDDDVTWSDYVNWVFLALLTAETQTINQTFAQSAVDNPAPSVDTSQKEFHQAVALVGNYAELYDRHLQSIVPRAPVNMQNNGTTPLIYSFPFGNNAAVGPGPVPNGTLQKILDRGYLRCGVFNDPLFSRFEVTGQQRFGLDTYICMALSAAIFNGTGSTQYFTIAPHERFLALANGSIDVLVRTTSVNYIRDVHETTTNVGYTFSPAIYYGGLRFGGIPPYGNCAERVDVLSANCKALKICVSNGTLDYERALQLFNSSKLIPKSTEEEVYQCLSRNESNAIGIFDTYNATVVNYYTGPFQEGTKLFSRNNLSPVTRQDDPQWSSFVTWVVHALFYAEEQNITQATYDQMPLVHLFGSSFATMFRNAIQAVGSYGELYGRSAGSSYPEREKINTVNSPPFDGPQHYPPPGLFGLS